MKNYTVSKRAKRWFVIMVFCDDFGGIEHEISQKMTYYQADRYFNATVSLKKHKAGKLIFCHIVADHSGIELALRSI